MPCTKCGEENRFGGRDDKLCFYQETCAVHRRIVRKFLKMFVNGIQPYFSRFIEEMDHEVQLAMHFKSTCHFISETVLLDCCSP